MSKLLSDLSSTIYEETILRERTASNTFLSWDTQPALFKSYPEHLFRYAFKDEALLACIKDIRKVTSVISVAGQPYYRLNTPSAGNLHPLELYVQIRGIKGLLSGIYHIDVMRESLVLIEEIESEGIEPFVGLEKRCNGMIVILSSVSFRSSWKYQKRAYRYIYLDAGHQIEALSIALARHDQAYQILSQVDQAGLKAVMGFDTQEEIVCAVAISGEKESDKAAQALNQALMQVQATDYLRLDHDLSLWQKQSAVYDKDARHSYADEDRALLEDFINTRRSARQFLNQTLTTQAQETFKAAFTHLPEGVMLSFATFTQDPYQMRLVLADKSEKLVDTLDMMRCLLDQSVVVTASMLIFITAPQCEMRDYIEAGRLGHRCYFQSFKQGLGCSGIGAFYDKPLQALLETPYILYVLAVGSTS